VTVVDRARCPTCRAEVVRPAEGVGKKLFPFCSERCQLIELGMWLSEEYRIPDQVDTSGATEPTEE
jgi:endogenous inhibitor of DNA gyrase (YacG/DUF329 family)